jgi:hypothetical protein
MFASPPGKAEGAGMNRPLSHVCANLVYAMFIALNAIPVLHGKYDPPSIVLSLLCVVQLLGALGAPRERRQYWVGSVVLWLIVTDALYKTVLWPGWLLYHQAPGVRATWPGLAVNAVAVGALFMLPYAYAFGEASRGYFGFPPRKK